MNCLKIFRPKSRCQRATTLVAAGWFMTVLCVQAQMVMNVDTGTEEFWFTGSGTANVIDLGSGINETFYEFSESPGFVASNDITFSDGVLFTTSNGSVGSPPPSIDTQILVGESVNPQIRLATNTPGLATFTGTGVRKSYSALFGYDSSVALQYIHTMLSTGGDFQGDSETQPILFNVVPEPSTLWLLLTALLAWRFLPQRRCRRYCKET